jgi:hypothetical protein
MSWYLRATYYYRPSNPTLARRSQNSDNRLVCGHQILFCLLHSFNCVFVAEICANCRAVRSTSRHVCVTDSWVLCSLHECTHVHWVIEILQRVFHLIKGADAVTKNAAVLGELSPDRAVGGDVRAHRVSVFCPRLMVRIRGTTNCRLWNFPRHVHSTLRSIRREEIKVTVPNLILAWCAH